MVQNSNSLVLEILKQENALKMSLFEQKDITSTLRHYSQCVVSFPEINKLCQEITFLLNKANKKGLLEPDLASGLKKTAQLLWDHLLTRTVKEKLKTAALKELVLLLDEELINIPWELLYDGNDFLSLKFSLGRLIRTQEGLKSPEYRGASDKLKILILANPTNDLKSAYLEGLNIKNQFDKKRNQIKIDFKSTQIDTFYIKKNLHDYDIVHFAGHCEYDLKDPRNTGWLLSDGRFTTQDILTLGETSSLPSLVFSNACQSAHLLEENVEFNSQQKAYNLAAAFLFSGVRHYIGAIRKIEDPVSLVFSQEFYTQLLEGKSVGESLRLSRIRLIRERGPASVFWASYLLYGDPNFSLFRGRGKPRFTPLKAGASFKKYKKRLSWVLFTLATALVGLYLYLWLPSLNPNSYFLLLKSQRLFSKGRNQEVILNLNRVIQKDARFLAAYPLLGEVYQRLGQSDKALKYYADYAFYSQKRNDMPNLASAYIKSGWVYHRQGEYAKAVDYYQRALSLSRQNNDKLNEAVALRKLALWYMDKEDTGKAMELLLKSSEINRERQGSPGHKYNLACDYFNLGLLFTDKDDLAAARDYYNRSQKLFSSLKLKYELSDYYFNTGEIYLLDKQYQKALDCYQQGLNIDLAQNNQPGIAEDYNMIGELYSEMGNLEEAEKFFRQALALTQKINERMELANTYYNLGLLYKNKEQKNKAREYLREAEVIYRVLNVPEYQKVKKELLELYAVSNTQ